MCRFVLGLLPGLAVAAEQSAAEAELRPVWRLASQMRFSEAEAALPAKDVGDDAKFARAMLRFNRESRTTADMDAAIAIFAALAGSAATPEWRARGLYYWARAEDLRQADNLSDPALKLYERLWREYPEEPFGQRALVHCLLHAFYANERRDAVLARCAALEQAAARLTDRAVLGHFHQVAARGYLHLGGAEAAALKHLLLVEQIGVARQGAWGDLQVSIGQLSGELGHLALARGHYVAFLREFPRDPRAFTVRALLEALPGGEGAAP